MHPSRMTLDPEGHYARLGVEPSSGPDVIAAAYRRKARLVHPDVPGTGDAKAFLALKEAYDVLSHAERRAAYDRVAIRKEAAQRHEAGFTEGEIDPMPMPEMESPPTRHPRPRDLPVVVWGGMAALLMVGVIEIGLHLRTPNTPARAHQEPIPANARTVPPLPPGEPARATYGAAPVRLAGDPNFYVVPASSPTILWRADDKRQGLVPWGQLPPFSAVQGIKLNKTTGMVEVRVTDNANGFMEAGRLTPGDITTAARAWCTYNTGPLPVDGEVLTHAASGPAKLAIGNRTGQPAVVKVRSPEGSVLASVYLGPGGEAALDGLPDEPVRLDYATGEVWSRACHGFAASMRARRLNDLVSPGGIGRLEIPPPAHVGVSDITDREFVRE